MKRQLLASVQRRAAMLAVGWLLAHEHGVKGPSGELHPEGHVVDVLAEQPKPTVGVVETRAQAPHPEQQGENGKQKSEVHA
jgi:hypothetical protein